MIMEMEFTQSEDLDIEFEEDDKTFENAFEELYLSGTLKSLYEYAVDGGYTGTEEEFVAKFVEMLTTNYLPLAGGAITGMIDAKGTNNIIDFGASGWFRGTTSSGGKFDIFGYSAPTELQVGGTYPALAFKGKNERPTYNGKEVALKNDVPTKKETWTFTLEDGSTVSKVVYVE